jgi:predicted dehydrogenase
MQTAAAPASESSRKARRPKLGFIGVGWIGAQRMKAVAAAASAEIVAITDTAPAVARAAAAIVPGTVIAPDLESLLQHSLDGVVIATPTALHAAQARSSLAAGLAVFCQKPLGRSAAETREVISAARAANRLLDLDMCYRRVRSFALIKKLAEEGQIGDLYACELVFHNAYGPDKSWYYDRMLSGGGCVIDLGIHLVDLALWYLNAPELASVSSRRFAGGRALAADDPALEDYAVARLDFTGGATATLACSWNLPAGQDAVIRATLYGSAGGLAVHNVNGSFYDFVAERYDGTRTQLIDGSPDDWGGRTLAAWVDRLAENPSYDPAVERAHTVARVIDAIYGRDPLLHAEEPR